ncbi:MAG: hypothetical protein HY842_14565 [Bacteroidetes bacterium]|nr:hypothetical protein [Bacteroidota bacterium]
MKKFATWLAIFLLPVFLCAQDESSVKIPRLSKTAIGQSGCAAYLPAGMPEFGVEASEDGSDVYTSELDVDGYRFGCIAVRFAEPDLEATPDEMEQLLIAYMEYLQGALEITGSTGIGTGHTLEDYPDARGVLDYWEDGEGTQYVVKGWVNQKYLGILLISGAAEYPYFNLQQMYLDGFRFGE